MVARFFAIGSWDIAFNGSGSAITAMGGSSQANSIAIAPGGKIVLAGTTSAAEQGFAVAVYNANGSPSTSTVTLVPTATSGGTVASVTMRFTVKA